MIYQPLPGHGRDSAGLLAAAGLARTCRRPRALTALLRSWIADPAALSAAHARAARWSAAHAGIDLAAVLGLPAPAAAPEARRARARRGRRAAAASRGECPVSPAVALVTALIGACGIATGTVLQQRAGQEIEEPDSTRALLVRVLRHRRWWTGQAVIAVGWCSYAFALHIGPVALVQPVLVTGLVFGTVASAKLARRRLDRRLLLASGACVLGLTTFLADRATPGARGAPGAGVRAPARRGRGRGRARRPGTARRGVGRAGARRAARDRHRRLLRADGDAVLHRAARAEPGRGADHLARRGCGRQRAVRLGAVPARAAPRAPQRPGQRGHRHHRPRRRGAAGRARAR